MRFRFVAPTVVVVGLAALIGCGGDSGGTDGGLSGSSSTAGDGGTPSLRAPAGDYALTLTGTGTTGATFTGSGTAAIAADGTMTLTYTSTEAGTPPITTSRVLSAVATDAGAVTGTVKIDGGDPIALIGGTLSRASNGSPLLNTTFVQGSGETAISETDSFSLNIRRPAVGTYAIALTGTDTVGGTYNGSGTYVEGNNGAFSLDLSLKRKTGGVTVTQTASLSATLGADGQFSGNFDYNGVGTQAVSGSITQNAQGSLVLILTYSPTAVPAYTVTQRLTLIKQ